MCAVDVLVDRAQGVIEQVGDVALRVRRNPFTMESQVVVQSTLLTPKTNRFTRAPPPRGSRDPLRFAEGGTLPYKDARHCPGFSLVRAVGVLIDRAQGVIEQVGNVALQTRDFFTLIYGQTS